MIKIKIKFNDNFVEEINVSGHANYDEYGKDIVCSSVSSIVITSVNLIDKFDSKVVEVKQIDGNVNIRVIKKDEIVNKILINMFEMLKELSNEYKKNVKIIE
ncbi:MAG: ribosomal-processing cysteine protease Prp [Bacilli bacterium]